MNVKYIKRKCRVRGCRNIGSFTLSRNREMGNSVIMCKECMELALAAANEYKTEDKPKKVSEGIPSLFFVPATLPPISGKGKPLVAPETVDKVSEILLESPNSTKQFVEGLTVHNNKELKKPKATRKKVEK